MSFPGSRSICSNKEIFYDFTVSRTRGKRKEKVEGINWMSYCPFPALGRDTKNGVAIGATGLCAWQACLHAGLVGCAHSSTRDSAVRVHDRALSARPGQLLAERLDHDTVLLCHNMSG